MPILSRKPKTRSIKVRKTYVPDNREAYAAGYAYCTAGLEGPMTLFHLNIRHLVHPSRESLTKQAFMDGWNDAKDGVNKVVRTGRHSRYYGLTGKRQIVMSGHSWIQPYL